MRIAIENVSAGTTERIVRERLKSMVLLNSVTVTVYLERFLFSWQKDNCKQSHFGHHKPSSIQENLSQTEASNLLNPEDHQQDIMRNFGSREQEAHCRDGELADRSCLKPRCSHCGFQSPQSIFPQKTSPFHLPPTCLPL